MRTPSPCRPRITRIWIRISLLALLLVARSHAQDDATNGARQPKVGFQGPCHRNCEHWIVVGNGYLDRQGYQAVRNSDEATCVAWFSKLKAFDPSLKITVLVSRHGVERNRWSAIPNPADVPVCPVLVSYLPMVSENTRLWPGGYHEPIFVYESYMEGHDNGRWRNEAKRNSSLFPSCPLCASGRCEHRHAVHGPTTGAVFIDFLERSDAVRRIDVYGMTFRHDTLMSYHLDWILPRDVIPTCCTKCRVHEPEVVQVNGTNIEVIKGPTGFTIREVPQPRSSPPSRQPPPPQKNVILSRRSAVDVINFVGRRQPRLNRAGTA
ncbi:hypothetical protein RI054_24g103770 [Pseudoscourfieldia marina]